MSEATGHILSNFPTSGSIGSASTTVDVYSRININQTTPSIVLTVPNPTNTTTKVTEVWIGNIGTESFSLNGVDVAIGTAVILKWTGSDYYVIGSAVLGTVVPVNTPIVAGMTPQQTANATQGQFNEKVPSVNLPPVDGKEYVLKNQIWSEFTPPVTPTLDVSVLSQMPVLDNIGLEWTASVDATNYTLQRSTAHDFSTDLVIIYSGSLLTFTDNINPNTDYYYRVRSSAAGYISSAWSNIENAFYNKTVFSTITTDTGVIPTTPLVTIGKNKTALQIITGDNSGNLTSRQWRDIEYDFYVQINSGTIKKIHSYFMNKFLVQCTEGDVVKISSNIPRQFTVAQINHSLSLNAPSGFTGTMVTDKAATYFFNPTTHHLQLPTDSTAFKITATGTRIPIFIKEYDGTNWSKAYHYILETSRDLTIHAGARLICVGTLDGQSLSITAPTGSSLVGSSQESRYAIPAITGTTYTVTANSESDLRAKIALAISGDAIEIPAGTYNMTAVINETTFTANISAGKKGSEGVIIKGSTGIASDVVIRPFGGQSGFYIDNSTASIASWLYDFSIDCTTGGKFQFGSGIFRIKNVTGGGVDASDTPGDNDLVGAQMNNNGNKVDVQFFDCVFQNASGDIWNFYGNASYPTPTENSLVYVVNCQGINAGPHQNSQCLTTHQGIDVAVIGGLYQDAYLDIIANEVGTSSYTFLQFIKARKGARKSEIQLSSIYGCDIESTEGAGFSNVTGFVHALNYVNHVTASGAITVYRNQVNIKSNYIKKGNTVSSVRAFYYNVNVSTDMAVGNIVEGFVNSGQGVYFTGFPAGSTAICRVYGNTFSGNADAIAANDLLAYLQLGNNAMKGNTNSISSIPAAPNNTHCSSIGYNILDPTLDTDFITVTGDVTGSDANLDANFIPTSGGNADMYGSNTVYGYIGDRDPFGLLKIRDTQYTPVGARAYQRYNSDALLIPEAY